MSDASLATKADPDLVRSILRSAVQQHGSQEKLATACGVKQASIWSSINTGQISCKLAIKVEAATGRSGVARELCPDLPPIAAAPAQVSA